MIWCSHCPWVWNCGAFWIYLFELELTLPPVGLNNHRQFIIFVTALVIGIISFDYLTWACECLLPILPAYSPIFFLPDFSSLEDSPTTSPTCFLPASVCRLTAIDMFLFAVAVWSTLQLVWTVVLLASQFVQIARQMTTLEVSNLGRYGFMGGRGGSLATQMSHRHNHNHALQADADDTLSGEATPTVGHTHAHGRPHQQHGSGCSTGFLMHLLGFDRFTSGKAANGLARAGHAANPFSVGIVSNCRDFWTRGRELGVEYDRLYEIPVEGLREAKRRREREEAEEIGGGTGGRKGPGLRQKLLLGLGIGGPSARAARGGYEPVSQV